MADSATPQSRLFDTIAVLGVGLIGGSIAAAVRKRKVAQQVIGVGRNAGRLEEARAAGLIDVIATDAVGAAEAELVIVCTPVDRIAADVRAVAAHLHPGAVVTDAGSVKGAVCTDISRAGLPQGVAFVGSHPLAGSEKSGWEHADADLFENRVCVVMRSADSDGAGAVEHVEGFWRSLGMRVLRLSPREHDRVLALTSHLPHLAAAALASLLETGEHDFAASGFRDTTRIAAGDADLWTAIFRLNAAAVDEQLARLIERLQNIRWALEADDVDALRAFLKGAKSNRDALERASGGDGATGDR